MMGKGSLSPKSVTIPLLASFFTTVAQAQSGYMTYFTGTNPNGITTADLNGDGKPDLVIANAGSNSLTALLNNGGGSFTTLASVTLTGANMAPFMPRSTVAADLNGDGKIDVVVIGYGGPPVVLLGHGDGTFGQPQPVPGVSGGIALQVADLNGDGIPDLAITNLTLGFLIPTGADLVILPGKGDGTFGAGAVYFLGLTPWAIPAIGDFNQDGKPDVAVAVGQNLILFLNDGKANFQTVISRQPWNFAPGIVTGDFNGDGLLDLAVSGQVVAPDASTIGQGIVTVLLGKGGGTFQAVPSFATPTIGQTIAAADLNHDGHTDLVVGLGALVYLAGRGDGTFESGIPFGSSGSSGYLAIGDFTGSSLMGFAGANPGGNVVILPRAVWPSLSLANVSAAGFGLGPLAPGSVVAALGSNLATETATASTGTPPFSLGGDSVTVTGADGKALPAQIYSVSPGQVNYVIPAGTAPGLATVSISSNGRVEATGQIDIATVAPALFTVNSLNLAAAYVTRVGQDGQQTYQPVYQTDANGNIVPLPIDLGSGTDSVYLSIFGTGIRNVRSPIAAIVNIGGMVTGQITYAGPQVTYDGLDQVNILLPRTLAAPAAYSTLLQLTVGGQPSNQVKLTIQ